ncbi:hypothetical protein HDU97_004228 [Phlyctochytrium planicorne]|nr:hypothetical protein HDU97_004228 [Phlyctochytrium planicorne]
MAQTEASRRSVANGAKARTTTTAPSKKVSSSKPVDPPIRTRMPIREAPTLGQMIEELLLDYRFLVVIPIVLPLSMLFTKFWAIRDAFVRHIGKHFRSHDRTVKYIQDQIQRWRDNGAKKPLCTARPGFMMVTLRDGVYKTKDNAIELPLYDILNLDEKNMTVRVQPGVNIGQLTNFLVPRGYIIPVVPELDDLTMGGMLFGYGIEGSSHKYGLFNDIVLSADVIVGTGEVVHCSPTENADLFRALPWSYGGVGFCVAMELKIIPVKKYCRLVYEPIRNIDDMVKRFSELAEAEHPPEYLEAIMYDYNNGILMHGELADTIGKDGTYNPMGKWWKPWFHKHAQLYLSTDHAKVEYIPIRDYYHRHTRSLYWEGDLIVPMGNHWLFRHTLGWLMPPQVNFLKLTQTKSMKAHYFHKHIAQDYLLPLNKLREGLEVCHEVYEVYPLWLCPHAVLKTEPQGAIRAPIEGREIEQYVDIGVWGVPGPVQRKEHFDAHVANREYEKWLRDNRGYQAMYAISDQNEEEFREMFDMTLYDNVRRKYKCEGVFMHVTQKVLNPK